MNVQQFALPKSSPNGYGGRKIEREGGSRVDNKLHSSKSSIGKMANTSYSSGKKIVGVGGASRDRLVYFSTCLIGHHVEVQVKNGNVYSGIFHAASVDKNAGIVLKMACLTIDASTQLQQTQMDYLSKAFSKTLIVPDKELVQIVAKDVSVTRDELSNECLSEKQQELLIDSYISQSRSGDLERELKPWIPEEDEPHCHELENVFDRHWDRGWDQFEVNETLFGVKSTFNEELYTTKLERGPSMRDLELKASIIAKEIEGEDTRNLHLAEERGINLPESVDIDEETRFSSVYRGRRADDGGYEEEEDIFLDSQNKETFGDATNSVIENDLSGITGAVDNNGSLLSSRSSPDVPQTSQSNDSADVLSTEVHDIPDRLCLPNLTAASVSQTDKEIRFQRTISCQNRNSSDTGDGDLRMPVQNTKFSGLLKAEDSLSSCGGHDDRHNGDANGTLPSRVTTSAPSCVSIKEQNKQISTGDLPDTLGISGEKLAIESHGRPGSSASSTSDCLVRVSASAGGGLTPSSSVGSLSSEKSTLNPNAKEFRLNPNAKSFVPSQAPVRAMSPVAESSFYFPANLSRVPQMHGIPIGVGLGPFVGHQPVIFNPQVAPVQSPQAYIPPAGPHYGQPMLIGHPKTIFLCTRLSPGCRLGNKRIIRSAEDRRRLAVDPRGVTASRLLFLKQPIPHYYLTVDTCEDKLTDLRSQLNSRQERSGGKRISVNDPVIKAAAQALRSVPQCNSSWIDEYVGHKVTAKKRVLPSSAPGEYKFASFMLVTLSCDHPVIDGAIAAEWLKAFKGYIENPKAMLL